MRISQANYLTNRHKVGNQFPPLEKGGEGGFERKDLKGGAMSKVRIIMICILMITVTACGSPEQKKAKHM